MYIHICICQLSIHNILKLFISQALNILVTSQDLTNQPKIIIQHKKIHLSVIKIVSINLLLNNLSYSLRIHLISHKQKVHYKNNKNPKAK